MIPGFIIPRFPTFLCKLRNVYITALYYTRPSFLGAYKNITDEIRVEIACDWAGLVAIHERCRPKFALGVCQDSKTMVWRQCVACNLKVRLGYTGCIDGFCRVEVGLYSKSDAEVCCKGRGNFVGILVAWYKVLWLVPFRSSCIGIWHP